MPRQYIAGLRLLEALAAPRTLVSNDAVPYRPHQGIYLIVEEPTGVATQDDYLQQLHTDVLPTLVSVSGVAGALAFGTTAAIRRPSFSPGRYRITTCYLDDDPATVGERLAPVLERIWEDAPARPGARRSVRIDDDLGLGPLRFLIGLGRGGVRLAVQTGGHAAVGGTHAHSRPNPRRTLPAASPLIRADLRVPVATKRSSAPTSRTSTRTTALFRPRCRMWATALTGPTLAAARKLICSSLVTSARPGEIALQQRHAPHAVDERGQESALKGAQAVHRPRGDLHLHDPVGSLLGDDPPLERLEGVVVGQDALRRRRTGIAGFHADHAFIVGCRSLSRRSHYAGKPITQFCPAGRSEYSSCMGDCRSGLRPLRTLRAGC